MALEPKKVEKAARKLRKFLDANASHIAPEEVHWLRTTIRKLEAAADAVLVKPNRRERAALRDIGRIRKRAGKIRDMDVLTADAISMSELEKQQDHLIELLHHLGSKRHKQARRLCSLVQKKGGAISNGVKRLSSRLQRRMSSPQSRKDASGAEEATARAFHLLLDLKRPPTLSPRTLHPYRLKVKKLRDVIRLAPGPAQAGLVAALGEVKDAIGDWHDWEELLSIATKVLDGQSDPLVDKIKRIAANKYSHALSRTLHMRRKYLAARTGRPSVSAVRSTSEIAS
jgi:CHAD domain-containing protein